MAKQKLLYGIDLGTTNSCIAVYQAGVSKAVPLDNSGTTTLPSCVMWKGGDNFVVGKEAYDKRGAKNVVYSSKRLMGADDSTIRLEYEGEVRLFRPEEIAAEVLKELVRRASRLHKNVSDVVVCVPAYFDNNQVMATKEAIKLAGLHCIQIAKEPTAAALVYNSVGELTRERVLIYDLGGGTFDVSLVSIEPPTQSSAFAAYGITAVDKTMFHVLGVDGNTRLGGDDIDDLLVAKCLSKLPKVCRNLTTEEMEGLKLFCEQSKKLSSLEASYSLLIGGEVVKLSLNLHEINAAVDAVFEKTLESLKRLLAQNGGIETVTQLITVGGSTLSKRIRERLEQELPNLKKNYSLNPDESVALGAAIQSAVLNNTEDLTVVDCLAGNYGISMCDGEFKPILRNGSPIPVNEACIVTTASEEQKELDVHFFQGMSPFAAECTYIGSVHVDNIIAGLVRVDMTVDSDGLLVVRANDSKGVGETKQLLNVLGREKQSVVKADKKISRWKAVAKKNEDDELLYMIERYERNKSATLEQEIISALRSYSKSTQTKRVSIAVGVDE